MKLTINAVNITNERRYRLDEPVDVFLPREDATVRVTSFVTTTRIYEYGEPEHGYALHGRPLKKDGTPNQREQARDFYVSTHTDAGVLEPFIEALWAPTQV